MNATVVVVAFRTHALDMSWLPQGTPVIVVHNDDVLAENAVVHDDVRHLRSGANIGFGAAVNLALPLIETERVVLCNPDVVARREHWEALSAATQDEIVVVPLLDAAGRRTSVVNAYPTPSSTLLTAYRVGRLLPRGSTLRATLAKLLGSWGRAHVALTDAESAALPLRTHWASGALLSVDAQRLRDVGGFDPAYFLYMEDVDLCRRLAARYPDMMVRLAGVSAASHAVGGSAGVASQRTAVDAHYVASIRRYARVQRGFAWRALSVALAPRRMELALRQRRAA